MPGRGQGLMPPGPEMGDHGVPDVGLRGEGQRDGGLSAAQGTSTGS